MGTYKKSYLDEIELEIINLTSNFTLEDWRDMRTDDYWTERDSYTNPRERNIYILQCVREYIRR